MNETFKSIALKIGALISFIGGIVVGFALIAKGVDTDDTQFAALGMALTALGVFVTAVLVQYIARHDGDSDYKTLTFGKSLLVGLMFTYMGMSMIFFCVGIACWSMYGYWQVGVCGVVAFVVMMFVAVEISIRYQTWGSRCVLKDSDATEYTGKIKSIEGKFPIFVIGKTFCLIKKYYIEIDGIYPIALLRSSDKRAKYLFEGDSVKVRFNPSKPRYCAIIERKSDLQQ